MENCRYRQFSMTFIEKPVGALWEKKSFETAPICFPALCLENQTDWGSSYCKSPKNAATVLDSAYFVSSATWTLPLLTIMTEPIDSPYEIMGVTIAA